MSRTPVRETLARIKRNDPNCVRADFCDSSVFDTRSNEFAVELVSRTPPAPAPAF